MITEGDHRASVQILHSKEVSLPADDRAGQLAWVRREILAILTKHAVDRASLRLAESGRSGAPNYGRAEVDGVVQAALAELHIPVKGYKSATVRSAFGKTQALAEAAMELVPCIASTAKLRREQLAVAVAQYPAGA
ncbi:hypothetical protein [Arthrobacter sp. ISL-5]|uniref:hypothetical protein n=1 Tax=Arthrobacter sp. ISL-5 TaxID=2819111 RepID=UPI001BEBC09B|nr:hypothetical protein [Arthrobacter sp. ISL-5]MBT2551626.1 hypothetical protein [Arthrobacter sp. ISL-5]